MREIPKQDLKSILHSKRANLYYLEHCRVLVNGGRIEYVTERDRQSSYWNIPIANTTTLLLGTGTSITQAAVRELARAGVMLGFCGGGGTPLFAAADMVTDILWMAPQSEYRPTEYLQAWVRGWFDDVARLEAARLIQRRRLERLRKAWLPTREREDWRFSVDPMELDRAIELARSGIDRAPDVANLLTEEARLSKELYRLASKAVGYGEFTRSQRGASADVANGFLDHGNYLAYGLAATATWVLGLPHGMAVLHGKTRRGGLVFDIADLVKDALILPLAFQSAMAGHTENEFRQRCIDALIRSESLDFMIDTAKELAAILGAAMTERRSTPPSVGLS